MIQFYYKIKVSFDGGSIYLASTTEPVWHTNPTHLEYTPLEGKYGDTVLFIKWADMTSVTWQFVDAELTVSDILGDSQ